MQLLLPSAKSGVLVEIGEPAPSNFKIALIVFGILMVLWGFLDVASRIPAPAGAGEALERAFMPAVML